jgi:hypothetical protein
MPSAIPFTQPGTPLEQVTLYTITSETVLTGTECPPPVIEIYSVQAEGEPRWFGNPPLGHYDKKVLTVYHVARLVPPIENEKRLNPCWPERKTKEHYFAIEPELERILRMPFASELIKLQNALNHERGKLQQEQQSASRLNISRNNLIYEIQALQRAPLWRRILVAFFPERYWPRHY